MIPNNKYRILAWFLSLAFFLPIVIKTQHILFPNHEHHCHSCTNHETGIFDICEIQEFDYFFFTPADIINVPPVISIALKGHRVESTINSAIEVNFGYSLRAPPIV